jgi:inward rectifier potassium channel
MSPWRLRGLHRQASQEDRLDNNEGEESNKFAMNNVCATDIFWGKGDSRERRTTVDGQEVVFTLKENYIQRPITSRGERQQRHMSNINVTKSHWEVRCRWWLLQYGVFPITVLYMAVFLAINFVFAALWSIQEGNCCADSTLSYTQIFDFAIQTATTIGYGGYVPVGYFSNFLVVLLSCLVLFINTVYAGLLFLKFVSPSVKMEFSDILTLSNVNGLPCLEFRIGNADGSANLLTDISVRFMYSYHIAYTDEMGAKRSFGQTEELQLLSSKRTQLDEVVWTLRHVLDEESPLFGLDLLEYPGSTIYQFEVNLNATQDVMGAAVFEHTIYQVEDIMIGHRFKDQVTWDKETGEIRCDYSKMNETVPHPVWYPTKIIETS